MEIRPLKIIFYTDSTEKQPFTVWQESLSPKSESVVLSRVARVRAGNLGDYKPIKKDLKPATLQRQRNIGLILRNDKMAKNRIYKNYEEFLDERLKDPKLAMAYLNETLHDEDHNVFLIALNDVLRAQGQDISALAQKAQVSRQNLYRMLSQRGNPRWRNITSLMDAMGMEMQLKYKAQRTTNLLRSKKQPVRQQETPVIHARGRNKI